MEEKLRNSGMILLRICLGHIYVNSIRQKDHTKGDLMEILMPYFKAGLENYDYF